jgi:hypothetical protein
MTTSFAGFDQAKLRSTDQLPDLPQNKIWLGDASGRPVISDVRLPNLTHNKVWVGDVSNRPIEGDMTPAAATYVIKTADPLLPNAQALDEVASGILKIDESGVILHAVEDVDYVSYATFSTENSSIETLISGITTGISALQTSIDALTTVTGVLSNGVTVVEVGLAALGTSVAGLTADAAALHVLVDEKAPNEATYIVKQPHADLPNAFALNTITQGLLYNTTGTVTTAVPDSDYATPFGAIIMAMIFG